MVPVGFGYPLDLSHQESQHKPLGDLSMEEIKNQLQQMKKIKKHNDKKAQQLYDAIVDNFINLIEYILEICQDINYDISYNSVKFLTYNDLKKIRGIKKEGVEYSKNPDNNTTLDIMYLTGWNIQCKIYKSINEYNKSINSNDRKIDINKYKLEDILNKNFSDLNDDMFLTFFSNFWIESGLLSISTMHHFLNLKNLFNLPYDFTRHKYTKDVISQEEQDLINKISDVPWEIIEKFPFLNLQATPEEKTQAQEAIKKILAEYKPEVNLQLTKSKLNPSFQNKSSSHHNKLSSKNNGNPIASILSPLGYVLGAVTIIVVPLTFTGAFIYFVMPKSKFSILFKENIKKLKQVK
jgi:hypothetical protein